MTRPDLEFKPYPWPVKLGTLALLGLPTDGTCTQTQYEKVWNQAIRTANAKSAREQFAALVETLRGNDKEMNYNDAFAIVKESARGKSLLDQAAQESGGIGSHDPAKEAAMRSSAPQQINAVTRQVIPAEGTADASEINYTQIIQSAVSKIMNEDGCDYTTAWTKYLRTENSQALFLASEKQTNRRMARKQGMH